MKRLAIIGSGITGIAAAYKLRNDFEVHLFEQNNSLGGHTNTVDVSEQTQNLAIDTGFIVYNETTYPRLTELFSELEVRTEPSNMSFSVFNQNSGLQYCGTGFQGLFAQKKQLCSLAHWTMISEIMRFHKQAIKHKDQGLADCSLKEYLRQNDYSDYFKENFIVPMASAVWSTPIHKMLEFPARSLIQFFHNHGFLGANTQLQWRTVSQGSRSYLRAILKDSPQIHIYRKHKILNVQPIENQGVQVHSKEGTFQFDYVLIATHADQALGLLSKPNALQANLLKSFKYEHNRAILHTDVSVMPPLQKIWSSWNYKIEGQNDNQKSATIYYMNRLQNLKTDKHYFVSINDYQTIDPQKTLKTIDYEHPLFTLEAIQAQKDLAKLNDKGPIFFAGSYFHYGFHEDALRASLSAVERIRQCL